MDNRAEHGHAECWVIGELLNEIDKLREQNEYLKSNIEMLLREARYASSE